MPGSADLSKFSQLSLGVAIAFFGVGVLPQQLLAEEQRLKDSTEKEAVALTSSTAQNEDISYAAADLQPQDESTQELRLAQREVDIDTFCRSYPYNSRCADYQPPEQRQKPKEKLRETLTEKQPRSGFALTGKAGTLGFGLEGVGAISPNFNGRLGVNYFDFGIDTEQSDIDYDADAQLFSVSALLDWYPSKRSDFRITGGLFYNNNKVDATARSTATLDIAGVEFPASAVGQLEGELTFPNTISPYVGIGYGNPVKRDRAFSFSIDLGVLFGGAPEVDLSASGPIAGPALQLPVVGSLLEDAIEQEEDDIEDDLSDFKIYPVLTIGISYHF
jgi:hypothetical protein